MHPLARLRPERRRLDAFLRDVEALRQRHQVESLNVTAAVRGEVDGRAVWLCEGLTRDPARGESKRRRGVLPGEG